MIVTGCFIGYFDVNLSSLRLRVVPKENGIPHPKKKLTWHWTIQHLKMHFLLNMGFSRIFQNVMLVFNRCIKQPLVVRASVAEVGLPQVLARERVAGDCNSAPGGANLSYCGDRKGSTEMGVSLNGGTPKSSSLIGFSIINHPFWGTPIFGNTQIESRHVTCHVFYNIPGRIHVIVVYLPTFFVNFYDTCKYINIPYMDPKGICICYIFVPMDLKLAKNLFLNL